ncbi:AzlC family ABC transporter permease [Brevibacterium sp. S111]|uniref:AzlC family ABC transporter permease n=1 Tax=unclassified Brevibacterium TaxID=2614124 RepID=UPI0010817ADE|nr:AzlC family ABC transporter permease [Brevibacterium sp. S111]TGD11800.1 branched-chain amino acid ABC transporter permease [Brevibacterium sp. S111]
MGSLFRTAERALPRTRNRFGARRVERTLPGSIYRAVAIVTVTIIAVALSYGAISAVSGFAWWQTLLLAMFALGGAAEFTFVGVIAAGGAPILAVLAGLLVNTRNFAFGVAVGPYFPQDWRALIASHWINDESTAISRTGRNDRAKWHAFLLMGASIALMWPSGAMVGQWLGNVIDADLLGLDAAFPIILFCLIRGDLKNRATLSLTLVGILVAVCLTPVLPLGLGAVTSLSVFVLVAAGWAVRSTLRRRRETQHARDGDRNGAERSAVRQDPSQPTTSTAGPGTDRPSTVSRGTDQSSTAGEDRR